MAAHHALEVKMGTKVDQCVPFSDVSWVMTQSHLSPIDREIFGWQQSSEIFFVTGAAIDTPNDLKADIWLAFDLGQSQCQYFIHQSVKLENAWVLKTDTEG